MKKRSLLAIACAVISLSFASCGSKSDKGEQARADYQKSLSDSIEIIRQQIDSCNNLIGILREEVNVRMRDFTTVAKPREVGSYTIMEHFANKYPLTSTGLVARIDENGRFELVAALSGKAFDKVTVNGPSVTADTDVVPNDQALNYRTAALTTVLFSGAAADSVGSLIADNELNPLTVVYCQGNPVSSWKLPGENAKMIAQTYLLYSAQKELNRLERRVPMLHEKINLIRLHTDKDGNSDQSAQSAQSEN